MHWLRSLDAQNSWLMMAYENLSTVGFFRFEKIIK